MKADTLPPMPDGLRVLHYSGITQAISDDARATAHDAVQAAQTAGARVSFDPNLRLKLWPLDVARPAILDALAGCDIALPGLDDGRVLLDIDNPEGVVAAIMQMGPTIVALTMGADGVLLGTADGIVHVATPRVEALDATGAGDCFDGAFLARLVAGDVPERAARYAAQAAALSTTGYGAVTPIPPRAAVEAALTS